MKVRTIRGGVTPLLRASDPRRHRLVRLEALNLAPARPRIPRSSSTYMRSTSPSSALLTRVTDSINRRGARAARGRRGAGAPRRPRARRAVPRRRAATWSCRAPATVPAGWSCAAPLCPRAARARGTCVWVGRGSGRRQKSTSPRDSLHEKSPRSKPERDLGTHEAAGVIRPSSVAPVEPMRATTSPRSVRARPTNNR